MIAVYIAEKFINLLLFQSRIVGDVTIGIINIVETSVPYAIKILLYQANNDILLRMVLYFLILLLIYSPFAFIFFEEFSFL
jgi:hypothetical protein